MKIRRLLMSAIWAGTILCSGASMAEVPRPAEGQQAGSASSQRLQQRPNVLIWMMDDVGFAQVSSYGGLVQTPNIDRVARMGLRYSNYHTAPICSASRAAILSGRMPHNVHIGGHAAAARDHPAHDAHIPASAGSIAANLKAAGYATFALGKWDHLPSEEASPAGPFDQWPLGQGFDRFYGFLAADADNWKPILINDATPIPVPDKADYHLSSDMADQAIGMILSRYANGQPRPFLMYWATGAAHAPHHAPKAWIDRYKGKFDMGWDRAREMILQAQIGQGLLPKGTRLASPPAEGMPAWEGLSPEQKQLYARQMEVFAAQLSHADEQFGRILDALDANGELENTIVIVTSDNGASAEGGPNGMMNEAFAINGTRNSLAENLPFIDQWGGPTTYPHYALGWAIAGNTPFRYHKQTTHEGGTRVPLVISWPEGIPARGELRKQFVHVSDIAPTILDAADVPPAEVLNNVRQSAMDGESVAPTFAGDPGHERAQYAELYGNKGLWWEGWSIVTDHRYKTWDQKTRPIIDEPWALYDLTKDPGQSRDLAAAHPDRVASMAAKFDEQAKRFNVYPMFNLTDSGSESAAKAQADFARRGGQWRYQGPVGNVPAALAPPLLFRSYRMKATLQLSSNTATGPIFAYGGHLGGIGLYLREGKPVLAAVTLAGKPTELAAKEALSIGEHELELSFGMAAAKSSTPDVHDVTIHSNGRVVLAGKLSYPMPRSFGISETFGIGIDDGSAVLAETEAGALFPGALRDIVFDFSGDLRVR